MIGVDNKNLNSKVSLCPQIKIYLNNKSKGMSLSLQFKNMNQSHQYKGMSLLLNNLRQVMTNLKLSSHKIKDKMINARRQIEFIKPKISVKIPISMNGKIGKTRKFQLQRCKLWVINFQFDLLLQFKGIHQVSQSLKILSI